MSERDAFKRILAALHEAALDPGRWPGASALIDEALGTHGSSVALGDGDAEEDYRIYFMWTCLRGQRRRDLERLWFETHYPVDEGIPRLRRQPFNRLIHITDLYTEEELRTSASYNVLRTLAHAGNAINVRLRGPRGSRILWQVNDPVDGAGWSSTQIDAIRRLLPHVRHTVSVQQALSGAGALGATLEGMLDVTGLGVVQLDARGRIVAANDRARSILRTGDGLIDSDGVLSARAPWDDDSLQSLLGRVLAPFGARGAGGSMLVRRPGALPPLVVHVHPVHGRETDYQVWPVAALVLVIDPAGGADIDPGVVATALDLTGMQSRVAVLLARGMSVPEIAAATGRKESTIRSHVKHVYARHGLRRQAELARLVLSLAATPEIRR